MAFFHYDGGVAADQATGRPLMGQPVRIFDEETDAPVQAYREGRPVRLVTGAHGLIGQFQTEDSTRRVRMEVGPVRLRQWSQEMIAAGGDAVAELERLTTSHISLDTDGVPFYSPGSTTVQVGQDLDGTPYIRL